MAANLCGSRDLRDLGSGAVASWQSNEAASLGVALGDLAHHDLHTLVHILHHGHTAVGSFVMRTLDADQVLGMTPNTASGPESLTRVLDISSMMPVVEIAGEVF